MDEWLKHYDPKRVTADEAVRQVKPGDLVVFSHACGEPKKLPQALVARASELYDVKILHMVPMGEALYCKEEYRSSFRHIALFSGAATRKAIWDDRADYIPCFFSQIPGLLGTHLKVDVAMVSVSPPDHNGLCSLGVSVDYTRKAVQEAKIVIAEVNPCMPRTHGNSLIHVSEIDYFVEVNEPLYELRSSPLSEEECNIGKNVAQIIEDGSCLQLGIGGIPDAVLYNLGSFQDLGIHSEMISNGVMDLVEKGVINCRQKTIHKDRMLVTFMMGSQAFYKWANDNPMIEMNTVDYVNNPCLIAQNRKMISINSALEVDLLGQVNADTLGPRQFSGVGGQVDFVRGASMSEGGKAIIALASTAKGGEISRIVTKLTPGSAVTTSRNDVDYVVTEFGIASLRGKTVRERMKSLVKIAHPKFQDRLAQEMKEVYG